MKPALLLKAVDTKTGEIGVYLVNPDKIFRAQDKNAHVLASGLPIAFYRQGIWVKPNGQPYKGTTNLDNRPFANATQENS